MKKFYFLFIAFCFFTGVNAQIINIPDANFKQKLLAASSINKIASSQEPVYNSIFGRWEVSSYNSIDINGNQEIEVSEAQLIKYLVINGTNATNLIGIEKFTNLEYLDCSTNQLASLDILRLTNLHFLECASNKFVNLNFSGLTNLKHIGCVNNITLKSINLSGLSNLEFLNCYCSQVLSLNLSGLSNLKYLNCGKNRLSFLNVNGLNNLEALHCEQNGISSLDVSGLINLQFFSCYNNIISVLDLSGLANLLVFDCSLNRLSSLKLSGLNRVSSVDCSRNLLTSIDISGLTNLTAFNCGDNSILSNLILKCGNNYWSILEFQNNSNLRYICSDNEDVTLVQQRIAQYGYTNCQVNTYCSFTPGGTFYTIQGSNKFDNNNNSCDITDPVFPNLKFNISDGTKTGNLISNTTGDYSIPVQSGVYTITPVLENSTYYTVSPTNVVVDFPTQVSPFTQNFCVIPKGSHSDVEVSLLPNEAVRPGFDAKYKIIYKNKGNVVENGSVNLTLDDAKMDYVSSSPVFNSQATNQFTWNYSNLQPFETRTIDLVFNMNSPMETPAVNGGDVLNYTATITSANTDEMPNDNIFTLNQTVVNSFDPNDITCLEGANVSTSKIGDYVHYMIRFENTGSVNATNIVVKDVVDNAKYDVNSIIPIKGSHDFYTRINGNNVEFIFENINLPFDDATNDGYVSFKIKTKASLVVGDTFSKNANIYFDYNFPITTNTATTTIAALANQDFEFETYFNLYPNPASSNVVIETKSNSLLYSVQIYNALGQLMLVVPHMQTSKIIDVSNLCTGNYFVKINSDKGTSITKFVKK